MNKNSFTLWLTGLPASGKTTLAHLLHEKIENFDKKAESPVRAEILDGDVMRTNFNTDLGFGKGDRDENINRLIFLSKILNRNAIISIVSAISPYRKMREKARTELSNFIEVFINCPLEICLQRDPKGNYKKAINNEIKNFTGISDPYEEPLNPEITIETEKNSPVKCCEIILNYLKNHSNANEGEIISKIISCLE